MKENDKNSEEKRHFGIDITKERMDYINLIFDLFNKKNVDDIVEFLENMKEIAINPNLEVPNNFHFEVNVGEIANKGKEICETEGELIYFGIKIGEHLQKVKDAINKGVQLMGIVKGLDMMEKDEKNKFNFNQQLDDLLKKNNIINKKNNDPNEKS